MTTYDPIDTRGQEQTRQELDERSQRAHLQEQDDLKWLMTDKRGRRIVWRWLERTGVWRLSFTADALAMAFNEGGRNQGLRLLDLLLTTAPKLYNTMMEESHDDRHIDE